MLGLAHELDNVAEPLAGLSATSRQRAWPWSRSVSARMVLTTALTIGVGLADAGREVALEMPAAALPAGAQNLARSGLHLTR